MFIRYYTDQIAEKHQKEIFKMDGPVGGDTYDDENEQSPPGAESINNYYYFYRASNFPRKQLAKIEIILALTYIVFLYALIAFVYFKYLDLKIGEDTNNLTNALVQNVKRA